jgi:hypothetical protein
VETYSTSDHLYADLGIPSGSTGRLPLSHRTRAGLDAEEEEKLDTGKRKRRSSRRPGSTPAGAEQAPEANTEETRPKRSRSRTRSRAGVTQEGEQTPAAEGGESSAKSASDKPRRRRRRRSSAEQAAPSAD